MLQKMYTFLAYCMLFCTAPVFARNETPAAASGWCNSGVPSQEWENAFQRRIADFKLQEMQNARTGNVPISIPIIVHVIYWNDNAQQNISKAQIDSQIVVLNRNFNGRSFYINNVPTAFRSLIGNAGITFCPAKLGANGQVLAEPGIERINAQTKGFSNPGTGSFANPYKWDKDYIDNTIKPATIWDPRYYCNVWVLPGIAGGIIGYATFPTFTTLDGIGGGNATLTTDGVVIWSRAYGKGGSTVSPYNQGGTTTHELGHWLGLRHISGDVSCGNDYCNDTPPQSGGNQGGAGGLNYGCPAFPWHANGCSGSTGPNGEMFMNFMDYSDDNCTNMFTNDQKTRMLTAMANGDMRLPLQTSSVCDTVRPAPIADFIGTQQSLTPCIANATLNFTDKTLFGATTWSWSFSGGSPSTSISQNPTGIVFTTPGLHDVTLTVTSPKGTSTITKKVNAVITAAGSLPLSENFEGQAFPPVGWSFKKRNPDPAINWEVREGYSAFGVGNKSMIFDNTSLDAQGFDDDIMSPKLNLTGVSASTLKFDVAYAPYYDGSATYIYDTLEVYLTDNCGTSYTKIYTKGGTALATFPTGIGEEFYPTSGQWRTDSVAIPGSFLNKPNVQVVFRNLGNYGHTIYIDNVSLSVPNIAPTASFTWSDTVICRGGSLTFTNASTGSPDSVRWTINGGSPSTSSSTTTVTSAFNTVGNFNVSLTVYKGGTAYGPFTKSIRVKTQPSVNIVNSDTSICVGASVTITATGATSYLWNDGILTFNRTVTPATTTKYSVTGTTDGCTAKDSVTVTVKPLPTVSAGSSTTICTGNSTTLTASGATTYQWTGGPANASYTVSPTSTTTYTVTGTTNGCSAISTVTVTVTNTPPVVSIGANPGTSICPGQSVTLTATGAGAYQWTGGPATAGYTVSPTSSTNYLVTGAVTGCPALTDTTTVQIIVKPLPTTDAGSNQTICNGQSATLTASGATTYQWTGGPANASYTVSPSSTTTYTVTGTTNGCSASDNVQVTVNNGPAAGSISQRNDTLFVTGSTGVSYNWYRGGLFVSTTNDPYLKIVQSGTYQVEVVGANTCLSAKSSNFSATITGIRTNSLGIQYNVIPNPNNGEFEVRIVSNKTARYDLVLYNVTGQEMQRESINIVNGINNKRYNFSRLGAGLYYLSLVGAEGISTQSIIIQ